MILIKHTLTILVIILINHILFANGGPISESVFRKTGNIRLLEKADISLHSEDLKIKIDGDYTIVSVEYKIKNNHKTDTVLYGFPVDAFEAKRAFDPDGNNPFKQRVRTLVAIDSFEVYENKQPIKYTSWVVDSLYKVGKYYVYRKWYMIKMVFNELEEKTLNVSYRVKNKHKDMSPGMTYMPYYSTRSFSYHLFPSSKWGNGIVKNFSIQVDVSDLDSNKIDYQIEGFKNLQKQGSSYSFDTINYDLKKSDRITLHYDKTWIQTVNFIEEKTLTSKIIQSAKASSNNDSVMNLFDGNPATVWKAKKGDWVEIKLNQVQMKHYPQYYCSVQGILALNGNYSSIHSFNKDGKIRKCIIYLNDTIKYNSEPWKREFGNHNIFMEEPKFDLKKDLKTNK